MTRHIFVGAGTLTVSSCVVRGEEVSATPKPRTCGVRVSKLDQLGRQDRAKHYAESALKSILCQFDRLHDCMFPPYRDTDITQRCEFMIEIVRYGPIPSLGVH